MNEIKNRKEQDFVKWYLEVISASKLVDSSLVQGSVVYSEYCLLIWERIKNFLIDEYLNLQNLTY